MILSIYTDASYAQETKDGGFAYWVDCYQASYQCAGYLPAISGPHAAEVYSINHAVESLLTMKLCPITRILIYTDSTDAINNIRTAKCTALFSMIELTQKNGMRAKDVFKLVSLVHVKAHTKNTDEASNKNNWCDWQAKQCRRTKGEFKATIYDNTDLLI